MPPFPESPRVIYERNPLEEVICQLRFQPLLRIEAELPAAFQDAVRNSFPALRESRAVEVPVGLPPELAEVIGRVGTSRTTYEFVSEDERYVVALTRDFLALTTRSYRRWEEFRAQLEVALNALREFYAPAAFTRVGLRYRDIVCRSDLDLNQASWPELLAPHIVGELGDPEVGAYVSEAKREVLITLPNGSARLRHGLGVKTDTTETCYVIDADYFTEQRVEVTDAVGLLGDFNVQAGRAFRWCINDRLHEALGPQAP